MLLCDYIKEITSEESMKIPCDQDDPKPVQEAITAAITIIDDVIDIFKLFPG